MICAEVTYDMGGGVPWGELVRRERHDLPVGTLLWQPKGGTGHVVAEGYEERDYGYCIGPIRFQVCECRQLDFEDHHWVVLARPSIYLKEETVSSRTTRDYACGECGAAPNEPCRWSWDNGEVRTADQKTLRMYHRDREDRFARSVNRQMKHDHESGAASPKTGTPR